MSEPEFAGYPVASATKNFLITYGPPTSTGQVDAEAYHRARAIAETCEADLSTLEKLFACSFQSDGRNRYSTWVHVPTSAGPGGASNNGWARSKSSFISIDGTVSPTGPAPGALPVYEEFARMLFVAELAEILMDFSPYGWDRGGSDGEALSIVLAAELHPIGYYQSGRGGPRVNVWLQSTDRPDWVTDNERTDENWVSFGCGVLFLNYLRYQLGYPLEKIIRTGWGPSLYRNPSLADRFDQLTGAGAEWAFPGFAGQIAEHIPAGSGIVVSSDNIFPLRPAHGRTMSLSVSSIPIGSVRGGTEKVRLKPGFICDETDYEFWRTAEITELDVSAFPHGFGAAKVAWAVNGVPLSIHGTQAWVDVPVEAVVSNPGGKATDLGKRTTTLTYVVRDGWNRSNLAIRNTASVGIYDLDVTASATETSPSDHAVTVQSVTTYMREVDYELEPRYAADRRRCNPEFTTVGRALSDLVDVLVLLRNAPDPPPDMYLDRILERAEQVSRQLAHAAETQSVSLESIRRELVSPSTVAEAIGAARHLTALPELSAVEGLQRDRGEKPSPASGS
ncbi:hypothetical protein ACPCHT_28210 [Nucisporomicrobium flavum]|uniref:hypothetical protein n=1 Tax=Nucisporomicrobium flavum TaxID=2785915 RepID=UPI003C300E4D